jgi:phosphoribosylanthranilate isomerase
VRVRCKICGITNIQDAKAAVTCGADALGFMFYEPSPRHVSLAEAAAIIAELPAFVLPVGVFVNAPRELITRAIDQCGLGAIQLHGEESPLDCQGYSVPVIKAFRVRDEASLSMMEPFSEQTWLVDSFQPGAHGGTGHSFQWDLLDRIRPFARPLLLAGGLKAENIQQAVKRVRPFGVDVSSGVELTPGRKCPDKMEAFFKELLQAGLDS